MATITKQTMRFVSRPYMNRAGLIPMAFALLLSWGLVALGFGVATAAGQSLVSWGIVMWMAVLGLALYSAWLTYRLIRDGNRRYELSIDGDAIRLDAFDKQQNIPIEKEISLTEVDSAEYYEPSDTAALLLHGRNETLEIPLWSFDANSAKQIVDYVRANGIKVIGVPNEIVI